MTEIIKKGINIEMENVSWGEIQRLQEYFVKLIDLQIHRIKNGKMILYFDNDGNLAQVAIHQVAWKKKKKDKIVKIHI